MSRHDERVVRPSYLTLLVALTKDDPEKDPKYTILHLAVDEVFPSCYDGANWTDTADMTSIMYVQKELGWI